MVAKNQQRAQLSAQALRRLNTAWHAGQSDSSGSKRPQTNHVDAAAVVALIGRTYADLALLEAKNPWRGPGLELVDSSSILMLLSEVMLWTHLGSIEMVMAVCSEAVEDAERRLLRRARNEKTE